MKGVKPFAASAVDRVHLAATGSMKALDSAVTGSRKALDAAATSVAGVSATAQGLLASALASDLNGMLAVMAKGSATIYDRAMDAEYLATHIGGGNHRLFDGGHTLAGAYEAVRAASPDDGLIKEGFGFVQGMFRDLTTTKGLPLANWDKHTYDQVAGFLESRFLVPRDWFYDLNSYDSAELVGAVVSVLAVALCWNRADTEAFAKLVGSIGVSAVISANPLLLVVMVVAWARAFQKARLEGRYGDFIDGQARGAVGSLGALAAASQVAVLGGPVGMSLLVGIVAGVLANKAASKVSVVEVARFAASRAKATAVEIRELHAPA